jgi:hypothetical protein
MLLHKQLLFEMEKYPAIYKYISFEFHEVIYQQVKSHQIFPGGYYCQVQSFKQTQLGLKVEVYLKALIVTNFGALIAYCMQKFYKLSSNAIKGTIVSEALKDLKI